MRTSPSIVLLAALLVGPWTGCDRAPVTTPPAEPPRERAPIRQVAPDEPNDTVLLVATRRLG